MARKKAAPQPSEIMEAIDAQGRLIMAEYVCDLREANDPDLELKTQVAKEAMERLSVHHLELFDQEVEALMAARKEGRV